MSLRYSLAIFHRPGALRINSIWRPCARLALRRKLQYDCASCLYAPACECEGKVQDSERKRARKQGEQSMRCAGFAAEGCFQYDCSPTLYEGKGAGRRGKEDKKVELILLCRRLPTEPCPLPTPHLESCHKLNNTKAPRITPICAVV